MKSVQEQLNLLVEEYNCPSFIEDDPISIPHQFSQLQDIEIAGFFAAIFAWGQRKTIINKSNDLLTRMDNAPHQFITQHNESDLKSLRGFVHRTFNETDVLYFVERLKQFYADHNSLEQAFAKHLTPTSKTVESALVGFYNDFFNLEFAPKRTQKHIASPAKNSTCKRINLYLKWMVRQDDCGVDFGCWQEIQASQLFIPLDVHVERYARQLNLLTRKQRDWKAVKELTKSLRQFDEKDPVKYDYALFGYGVNR